MKSRIPTIRQVQHPCAAFSLIEMLVVIAIIGLLAALILNLGPLAHDRKTRARVKTELEQLTVALESYKAKRGFYPPDNDHKTFSTNTLYYELLGTFLNTNPPSTVIFQILNTTDPNDIKNTIPVTAVKPTFGFDGFVNSNDTADDAQNFHPRLKENQVGELGGVRVLGISLKGPTGNFSPWYYNSSSPTNNPNSYDLWVEVTVGGKTRTFGNWKEK